MGNTKDYAESVELAFTKITELDNLLRGGEYGYKLKSLVQNHASLFDRFCPYKVGDKVKLIKVPVINEKVAWGWMCAKHFLVEGTTAKVLDTDYRNNLFFFGLKFDDESWIDRHKNIHPIEEENRAIYYFSEDYLTNAID